jgi:hypothetical protein
MLAKLKVLWAGIAAQLLDIWNRSKVFILAILALVIAFEWQKLKEYLMVKAGQKELQNADKQDVTLANQEQTANNAANALVQQAQQLPNEEQPIGDDWNKQ